MPGWMSSADPPLASAVIDDARERGAGLGRVAVQRDLALVLGLEQVGLTLVGAGTFAVS